MLSNKLFDINPQKYTIDNLPINIAVINFLKSVLDKPHAIFIRKAGENGSAIISTKLLKLIFFTAFNGFSVFDKDRRFFTYCYCHVVCAVQLSSDGKKDRTAFNAAVFPA